MSHKTEDYCSHCPQKDSCKEVYEQLGRSDAPPVACKVFWAFLAPIFVFIGLLAGLMRWLPPFANDALRTLTLFLASLAITVAVVWLGRLISGRQ